MIVAHNFSPENVGLVLPIDILMPIVGFMFLWLSYKHPQPGTANRNLILAMALATAVADVTPEHDAAAEVPDSRTQWFIFAAAFMISACTTGIMSAM